MPFRSSALALTGGVLIASVPLFCACASSARPQLAPTGTSEMEVLPPPPQKPVPEGHRTQPGRIVIPPIPKRLGPPRYPDAALGDEIACVAELLYHVEIDGTARLVRLEWQEPPPDEHLPEFEDTIRIAVADWEYTPALRLVPQKLPDGSTRIDHQPVPKARHAVVRFRVVNGKGVVE